MQISAGALSLAGSSTRSLVQERSASLTFWVGDRPSAEVGRTRAALPAADGGLTQVLERAAKAKATEEARERLDPELEKLVIILEKVFGAKGARVAMMKLRQLEADRQQAEIQPPAAAGGPARAGWGLVYEYHERTVETQSASLSAEAVLTLDDGRTLAFRLDWSQSSLRIEERSLRLALGDAVLKDPLVLDLDGDGIRFSGELAALDLDGDGSLDRVARPAGADRIVALDQRILGAASGEAFRELAALDDDGNGWIDSGDAVWNRLQLWDGLRFTSLAEGGVAAIATASVALPYQHRDADGALQAVGRRGGVFLMQDGRAGAVAQVDLVA